MKYTRNKHIITNVETGEVITCRYINEAKRKSRELQKQGHKMEVIK